MCSSKGSAPTPSSASTTTAGSSQGTSTGIFAQGPSAFVAPLYQDYLLNANQLSETPFNPATQSNVTPLDPKQVGGVEAMYSQGLNMGNFEPGRIQEIMSPYIQDVVGASQNWFNNQNAIQGNQLLGQGIRSGNAFGGDRMGMAAAELAGQQQLAQAPVIAGLYQAGYTQALDEYNKLKQFGLIGAEEALKAGTVYQAQGQREADVATQNAQLQSAYPFQLSNWYGASLGGIGPLLGSVGSAQTATTANTSGISNPPTPNPLTQALGIGSSLIGIGGGLGLFKRGGLVGDYDDGGYVDDYGDSGYYNYGSGGDDNYNYKSYDFDGGGGDGGYDDYEDKGDKSDKADSYKEKLDEDYERELKQISGKDKKAKKPPSPTGGVLRVPSFRDPYNVKNLLSQQSGGGSGSTGTVSTPQSAPTQASSSNSGSALGTLGGIAGTVIGGPVGGVIGTGLGKIVGSFFQEGGPVDELDTGDTGDSGDMLDRRLAPDPATYDNADFINRRLAPGPAAYGKTDFLQRLAPGSATYTPPSPSNGSTTRGSWYGQAPQAGWIDRGDRPGSNALGVSESAQGLATPSRAGLGEFYNVWLPGQNPGRDMPELMRKTDVGPAAWTGRGIDISAAAAERAERGYTPRNFPTDRPITYAPVTAMGSPPGLPELQENLPGGEPGRYRSFEGEGEGGGAEPTMARDTGGGGGRYIRPPSRGQAQSAGRGPRAPEGFADRWARNPFTQAGIAMLASRSPYFGEGLAAGLGAAARAVEGGRREERGGVLDKPPQLMTNGDSYAWKYPDGTVWDSGLPIRKGKAAKTAREGEGLPGAGGRPVSSEVTDRHTRTQIRMLAKDQAKALETDPDWIGRSASERLAEGERRAIKSWNKRYPKQAVEEPPEAEKPAEPEPAAKPEKPGVVGPALREIWKGMTGEGGAGKSGLDLLKKGYEGITGGGRGAPESQEEAPAAPTPKSPPAPESPNIADALQGGKITRDEVLKQAKEAHGRAPGRRSEIEKRLRDAGINPRLLTAPDLQM